MAPISTPSAVSRTPFSSVDSAQIDKHFGLLNAVLQPVHAVEPARQHQRIYPVLLQKLLRVGDGTRLIQLEGSASHLGLLP